MSWLKVSDTLHKHQKVMDVQLSAMGLWVLAGSWSRDLGTDGFVPRVAANRLCGLNEDVDELASILVDAGLWESAERNGKVGWIFHDWTDYQRTAVDDERLKAQRSEAGRRGGQAKAKQEPSKTQASAKQVAKQTPSKTEAPPLAKGGGRGRGYTPSLPPPVVPEGTTGQTHDDHFDEFWSAYPRKDSKQTARKAFARAAKSHGSGKLIEEVQRWAGLWSGAGIEKRFIPHAATWLNQERWEDEPPPPRLRAVSGGNPEDWSDAPPPFWET